MKELNRINFQKNKGIYLLEIKAEKSFKVKAKRFQGQVFEEGIYYYAGSAQKNLVQRLNRHLAPNKKIHWHIDHLTTLASNIISQMLVIPGADKSTECEVVRTLKKEYNLHFPVKKFGNSDCQNCYSHLLHSNDVIDYNHFLSLYQSTVRLTPSSMDIS